MRRKMWFGGEIHQTLKKRKRAHIVVSIIRQFFVLPTTKANFIILWFDSIEHLVNATLK